MNSQHVLDDTHAIAVPPELAIPSVEDRFTRQRHRDWLQVRTQSHQWMVARRLLPADIAHAHANALRYVDLIAGYYVGASIEALQVIADFSIWFFIWDDHHGRYALHRYDQRWARLRDALHLALDAPASHIENQDPLVAGLADCALRFYQPLDEHWSKRFAGHFHDVIDAYDQEYLERTTHHVPTVEQYVALRCHTFGYRVWLDCLELAAGIALPPEVLAWKEYENAGLASQEFSGWYNDLCSLSKELASGELHNLGISLIHHHGLSVLQAMAEVRRRVAARVQDFLQAEHDLLRRLETAGLAPETDRALRHCLFNMRNWISSVYWFHHESGRYRIDEWADRARPPYISDAQLEEGAP